VASTRSSASVAAATAESKPNVKAVAPSSLSIVFGTPTTGMPRSWNCWAIAGDPSPPTQISPRIASCRTVAATCPSSAGSIATRWSSATVAENRPLLVEPRIVPPCVRMPAMFRAVSDR